MNVIKLIPIVVGPWGPGSGNSFEFNKEGNAVIKKITIHHGSVVDSLTFEYETCGSIKTSESFGGPGGPNIDTLILDSIGNIEKIEGTYGFYKGEPAINTLSFITSDKTYGPYGKPGDATDAAPFEMPTQGGKIVGFHGEFGIYVSSIGAYMVCVYT